MKRILISGLLILFIFLIAGCNTSKTPKLYIYNWTYYTPEEVITGFEKEFGVKVVYDEFASNEEMFAKLKAGGTGYDITFPSGDYVSIMIHENMLEALDKSQIPNFANIDPAEVAGLSFDPGNHYSIPYMKGASGIAVNTKFVSGYKHDLSLLLKPELKGRITLLDDMREVLGFALKSFGYSVNSINPAELARAKELVLSWKNNIQKFDSEAFGKAFALGEFWVVQGYEENVFSELEESDVANVDFFIPETGGPMYMDSMVILKNSKNKELAYKFINYIHRPEVYAQFVDAFAFPCINLPARAIRTGTPKYDFADLKNCEYKEDLAENLELYNQIWQEIRVGD